ncbi:MAG: transcriptional regulator [Gammaproteobacteria bacterium]|nr:MAG: transcriptional regulator [Gammaproteobacteria bacterium]
MSEFVEYLKEVFEQFGDVHARKMFGGYGIYHDGVMFGLVADDILYLKADTNTAEYFKSRNLGQFEYDKGGKMVKMSYYLAPEEIFDNAEEATLWAKRAYEAAFRAKGASQK